MQLIWDEFLKIIREEAGSQVVETWFKAISLERWHPETKEITLKVPNQFIKKWIQDNYTHLLKIHLSRLLHSKEIKIVFLIAFSPINAALKNNEKIIPARVAHKKKTTSNYLPATIKKENTSLSLQQKRNYPSNNVLQVNFNENYRFDTFIVGPSNSLAHAAAYAVSNNLGTVYNPLFIYGGTGLGKTHLLHALGYEVKKKNPKKLVSYVSADKFVTEFINSIRFDKVANFRNKYQNVDLFLVDDIQFLSNKEQTQEIFFHIFNNLYEHKKQIILSSDTFPNEIEGLQSRLRSRMEWGLVADIQIPDLETKIAILEKKSSLKKINLPDDVANFIASRVISNIRELEGALIRVSAFANLTKQPITLAMVQKVLLNLKEKRQHKESNFLDIILKIIGKNYSISLNDIKSKKRHKNIVAVRQISFYLMKKLTKNSLKSIGNYIGGRDHSTVIHAVAKVEERTKTDHNFVQKIKKLEQEILML
jgi:chromosomal replication initiator protein